MHKTEKYDKKKARSLWREETNYFFHCHLVTTLSVTPLFFSPSHLFFFLIFFLFFTPLTCGAPREPVRLARGVIERNWALPEGVESSWVCLQNGEYKPQQLCIMSGF